MSKKNRFLIVIRLAGFILRQISRKIYKRPLQSIPGMMELKDVGIPMRDGIRLMGNIYLPDSPGKYLCNHVHDAIWERSATGAF